MTVKFYNIIWLVLFGIAGIFYLTGNMTPAAGVLFGFAVFGWIFMGMMSVLPGTIAHPPPAEAGRLNVAAVTGALIHRLRERFHESRKSWMSSGSIEVRRPKYH